MSTKHLQSLGVYGYDKVEPVILAALVTADPLLLVGRAGTGKTYLLNSLSEALELEHRHYNASLIAFDDLVGFPYPEADGTGIHYIETPATIWKAESVLVDEINRCKPEHQNRLFSLVHERRIQGMALPNLKYRWAAMNPAGLGHESETYLGCEPLDPALSDRFAYIVHVADWDELNEQDRAAISDPRGEGRRSNDASGLRELLREAREQFELKIAEPDTRLLDYVRLAVTQLNNAGLRISPRRARQFARNLTAIETVSKLPREQLYHLALFWSLPQRSGMTQPDDAVVRAAHRNAWDAVFLEGEDRWLYTFHSEQSLPKKIEMLLTGCTFPDTGTLAVSQLIAAESQERCALFAYVLFPALVNSEDGPVGAEGVADLGRIAKEVLEVSSRIEWRDRDRQPYRPEGGGQYTAVHPDAKAIEDFLSTLSKPRQKRARQFLYYLMIHKLPVVDLKQLEKEINTCVRTVRRCHGSATA
jgi:MoxR-like ATPase